MIAVKRAHRRSAAVMLAIAGPLLGTACASPPLSLHPGAARAAIGGSAARTPRGGNRASARHPSRLPGFAGHPRSRRHQAGSSPRGRWASRFSVTITHYLTRLIAAHRPDALVTDQPQVRSPEDRIFITISTFDVTRSGTATLEADWTIVPRNPAEPERLQRARFAVSGPVATDQDVVTLVQTLLVRLADAIERSLLPPQRTARQGR